MLVEITDPKTKKKYFADAQDLNISELEKIFKPATTEDKLAYYIDNMNIRADMKSMLYSLSDFAIKVGKKTFEAGRKILETIIYIIKKYPNVAINTLVALILSALISSIPLFGIILGPLVTPILLALGIGIGYWQDFKDNQIKKIIEDVVINPFNSLKNIQMRTE